MISVTVCRALLGALVPRGINPDVQICLAPLPLSPTWENKPMLEPMSMRLVVPKDPKEAAALTSNEGVMVVVNHVDALDL